MKCCGFSLKELTHSLSKLLNVVITKVHNFSFKNSFAVPTHGKEYAEKLAQVAIKIQDESERLVETK